jgi:hypothetical protein
MFPPLTRNPTDAGRAPARQPEETIRAYGPPPAWLRATPLRATTLQRSRGLDHPLEVVFTDRRSVRINGPRIGHLSDLAPGVSTLRCDGSGACAVGRTTAQVCSVTDDRSVAGTTRGNGDGSGDAGSGESRAADREETAPRRTGEEVDPETRVIRTPGTSGAPEDEAMLYTREERLREV